MQRNSLENKILEKENILVVLPENPKLELLSAVLGFALALERLNKNVRIISDDSYRKYGFLRPPKHISSDIDDYGEIFISIDTKNNIVSELRYEKLDDEIRIYLGSEGAGLKKNSVSAKFLNTPYDLILVFGVDSAGELENFYKKNTDIFEGADVAFINKEFYSDFILDLIYKLKGVIDPQVATNLFASALIESANKARLSDTRPLKILSYLLKSGADHAPITKHLKNGELTKNEAAEIILKNIAHAKEGLLISKIPHFELERISLSSNDLISAIMDARLLVQKNNDLVVLVETPKDKVEKFGTLAVFTSENKENLEKISRAFNGSHKNKTALFSISSQNLKEAEDKMLKLARHLFKT